MWGEREGQEDKRIRGQQPDSQPVVVPCLVFSCLVFIELNILKGEECGRGSDLSAAANKTALIQAG